VHDLVKLALSPAVMEGMSRAVKGFGSGAGMGAAVGGLGGAALGGVKGFQKERAEGGSGIGGALSGALSGAGKGALLGTAAGGALGAARPAYAAALSHHLPGSDFGQRQVHALTGFGDAKYVRSIGSGAADAEERLHAATRARSTALAGGHPELYQKAREEFEGAQKGFHAAEKAESMGLTSLPGYARALFQDPKAALKTGLGEQWHSMGPKGKAALFGMPAAFATNELAHGGTDEEGRGRFERTGRSVGQGLAFGAGPIPIAGQFALDPLLEKSFGGAGKFVDRSLGRLRSRRQPQVSAAAAPDPAGGDSQAEGHVISDRAAGVVPEGING
jgi:hypothetical protein